MKARTEDDNDNDKKNAPSSYSSYLQHLTQYLPFPGNSYVVSPLSVKPPETPPPTKVNYTQEQVQQALADARAAKYIAHYIENFPKQKVVICALGCLGPEALKKNLESMNSFIGEHPELEPDFFLILGDNFYPNGVSKPDHERFETEFHQIFDDPKLTHLKNARCILMLGNHDSGRDTETEIYSHVPLNSTLLGVNPLNHNKEEAELQQAAHSYLLHPSDPDLHGKTKAQLFKEKNIDYHSLPKYLMPHYIHSWIIHDLQIFAINTNRYMDHFLGMLESFAFDQPLDPNNQTVILERDFHAARNEKRTTILSGHHAVKHFSKRGQPPGWDAHHYLTALKITKLNRVFQLSPNQPDFKEQLKEIFLTNYDNIKLDTTTNHGDMLRKAIYDFQKINPTLYCAAHEHAIFYYNNKNANHHSEHHNSEPENAICEIISGAAGDRPLDHMLVYADPNVGCYMPEHGAVFISYDKEHPGIFNINVVANDGKQIHFTSENCQPIRHPDNDPKVTTLRDTVLKACSAYQGFLDAKQEQTPKGTFFSRPRFGKNSLFKYNKTHTLADIDNMNKMINFLNQPGPASYEKTIQFLYNQMNQLGNKTSAHSLYMSINKALQLEPAFKMSMAMLAEDAELLTITTPIAVPR